MSRREHERYSRAARRALERLPSGDFGRCIDCGVSYYADTEKNAA